MARIHLPDPDAFRLKRLLRKTLLWILPLALALFILVAFLVYHLTAPKRRGHIDLDTSRVETVSWSECRAELGHGNQRVQIQLLEVAPETTRGGVHANLLVTICNPNNQDMTTTKIEFQYSPPNPQSPGIYWALRPKLIGSGFCENYRIQSRPLGELVSFTGSSGQIEIRTESAQPIILELPGGVIPTATPTHTATETPPPTPTSTPRPTATPLPTIDPDRSIITHKHRTIQIDQYLGGPIKIFEAPADGILELNVSFGYTVENETKAVIDGTLPEDFDRGHNVNRLQNISGRPIYMELASEHKNGWSFTAYIFPVLHRKRRGPTQYHYFADTLETTPSGLDPRLRSMSFRILMKNGETLSSFAYLSYFGRSLGRVESTILNPTVNIRFYQTAPSPTPTRTKRPPTPTKTPRPTAPPPISKRGRAEFKTSSFFGGHVRLEIHDRSTFSSDRGARKTNLVRGESIQSVLKWLRVDDNTKDILLRIQGQPAYFDLVYPKRKVVVIPFIQDPDEGLRFPSSIKLISERTSAIRFDIVSKPRHKVIVYYFSVPGGYNRDTVSIRNVK